jgi:hypothetical protein
MGFTVTHEGGTKDAEFQAYVRLLRQSGVDLGKLPRVPEPGTGRRWLYVWKTAEDAGKFAAELRRRTGDDGWEVVPSNTSTSEGPLGPILIQLARRADGLLFALPPLSRAVIHSAFPDAAPAATTAFIDTQQWSDFLRTRGGLPELVQQLAPSLTGLSSDRLEELGYAVVDTTTDETLVSVPPAHVVQG